MAINFKKLSKKFSGKKVLVTGHTGFKGSWLVLILKFLGAKVIGVSDKLVSSPSHFQLIKNRINIKNYFCDVRNIKKFKKVINKEKPDYIFHLAAQSLVKKSYSNPLETWSTNLGGTINLLEILRTYKTRCIVIFITSDKVYKNIETKKPYNENSVLGGYDPYSCSKSSADLAIQSYIQSYFIKKKKIKIAIARAGNVVGGGDWSSDRLIPDCIKSWSKSKNVDIRQPNSTRPWQHVIDIVYGYLTLSYFLSINKKINHEAFNFGPDHKKNHKVKEVIALMKKNWKKANWKYKKNKTQKESVLLNLDSRKAILKLSWKPILKFKDVIEYTTVWYKNYYEKKIDTYDLSVNQIKKFENLLN